VLKIDCGVRSCLLNESKVLGEGAVCLCSVVKELLKKKASIIDCLL